MASRARRISKQEWKQHKSFIEELLDIDGLPLHASHGKVSVVTRLQDEHNFTVSRNQLDAFVKSLDRPRNLKKAEWRAVHRKCDELRALNIETRVSLSGKYYSSDSLQRARRHAFDRDERWDEGKYSGVDVLPRPGSLVIEIKGIDGKWSNYAVGGEHTPSSLSVSSITGNDSQPQELVGPVSTAIADDCAFMEPVLEVSPRYFEPAARENSNHNMQIHQDNPSNDHLSLEFDWLWSQGADQYAVTDPVTLLNTTHLGGPTPGHAKFEDFNNWVQFSASDPFIQSPWHQRSPFSELQVAFSATPVSASQSEIQSRQRIADGDKRGAGPASISSSSPIESASSLLRSAAKVLEQNSRSRDIQSLPNRVDLLDNMDSLLPEITQQDSFDKRGEIVPRDVASDSHFHNALLYSIANGFAGLRNIPPGAILRMLKEQHGMSNRIIKCLDSCPLAIAKSIADNLFRAAVEACDEEAVTFILQTSSKSPYKIDPNAIVCRLDGNDRVFTAIELAAKFRHLGIVQILIAAGVNVNHTHEANNRNECGPLELAIRKRGKFEPVDMVLVRSLLSAGAEVRPNLIAALIRWRQEGLLRKLIGLLPPASHKEFFQNSMLTDIAECLEGDLAVEIIKRIVEYCRSSGCSRCWDEHPKIMQSTLTCAARRANRELVSHLLPLTTMRNGALVAAVRGRDDHLIALFLEENGGMGGPPCCLCFPVHENKSFSRDYCPPCTPLAEAIRSQNRKLIENFELRGALTFINEKKHFEAAIFAAAEVGNCSYVEKLLQLVPGKRGGHLTAALTVAIRKDETRAALMLIENGADVNESDRYESDPVTWTVSRPPLLLALEKHNREVVHAILEAEVNVNSVTFGKQVMELAGIWGDVKIIDDLILMGAKIDAGSDTTALSAAVSSGDQDLVEYLLDKGASPNAKAVCGVHPLALAIENKNGGIFDLLISRGAGVDNEDAFLSAMKKNLIAFETLLSAFSLKYPKGKAGFGGTLLIEALKQGNATLLDRMLAAKFDVNSFSCRKQYLLTPLGFAIRYWNNVGESPEMIWKLVSHGDPNSVVLRPLNSYYSKIVSLRTALLIAVETRREDIVQLLLENGAEVNREARRGLKRTPLQRACEIGSFKIVQLLLQHKAEVNQEPADRGGATALQLAAISGSVKIAELLLKHGAQIQALPAKVDGRTAFEGAAEHGCVEMIRLLWNAADGNFSPAQIEKARGLALGKGHRGCADYLASLSSASTFFLLETN